MLGALIWIKGRIGSVHDTEQNRWELRRDGHVLPKAGFDSAVFKLPRKQIPAPSSWSLQAAFFSHPVCCSSADRPSQSHGDFSPFVSLRTPIISASAPLVFFSPRRDLGPSEFNRWPRG